MMISLKVRPIALLLGALFTITLGVEGQAPELVPTIAKSGDVEIQAIRIQRETVSGAAKGADLTNMRIQLWLTEEDKGGEAPQYLAQITKLNPIEDDTGKVLLTIERREGLAMLRTQELVSSTCTTRGRTGPLIEITLDAPSRRAISIKRLQGIAQMFPTTFARLSFDKLHADGVTPLKHPALKELRIIPNVTVRGGKTTLSLRVPEHRGRVMEYNWGLIRDGVMLPSTSESMDGSGLSWEKTYDGDQSGNVGLTITVAQPETPRTLDFDFQNVELP